MKRIMVDMSATLIHNGHIRILKAAKEHGYVIVALTTDEEILKKKGYEPELDFASRREVIEAIRFVDEVVPCPWLIEETFLDQHRVDLLVHGSDNSNPISHDRLLILPRTSGISTSIVRGRVLKAVSDVYLNKE
jgi:glycerol-3-phosphate cytidylyltransferase